MLGIIKRTSDTSQKKIRDLLRQTVRHGDCRIWTRAINFDGYPRMAGNVKVHRLMYELWTGEDIKGLVIRHKCDNPLCVSPLHLESGTSQDNVRDRHLRGRTYSKLSKEDGSELIQLWGSGSFYMKELASIYHINPRTVSTIVKDYRFKFTAKAVRSS